VNQLRRLPYRRVQGGVLGFVELGYHLGPVTFRWPNPCARPSAEVLRRQALRPWCPLIRIRELSCLKVPRQHPAAPLTPITDPTSVVGSVGV
jgi:hypothetical protein